MVLPQLCPRAPPTGPWPVGMSLGVLVCERSRARLLVWLPWGLHEVAPVRGPAWCGTRDQPLLMLPLNSLPTPANWEHVLDARSPWMSLPHWRLPLRKPGLGSPPVPRWPGPSSDNDAHTR